MDGDEEGKEEVGGGFKRSRGKLGGGAEVQASYGGTRRSYSSGSATSTRLAQASE